MSTDDRSTPPSGPGDPEALADPSAVADPSVSPRAELAANLEAGALVRAGNAPQASPAAGLFLFVMCLVLFIMLGPLVSSFKLGGVVALQLLCLLAPSLLFIRWLERPVREVLALRRPDPRAIAGAVLLGSSVWFFLVIVLLPLQNRFLPVPDQFLEQREALLSVPENLWGQLLLWGAAALTPAICEEVLFRGVLLHSCRTRLGDARAIALVSLLFALFHFNPYQLSITFLMGCLLGWLRFRTGTIVSCMVFHLLNNSLVLAVSRVDDEVTLAWASGPLAVLMLLGFMLVRRSPGPAVASAP